MEAADHTTKLAEVVLAELSLVIYWS